MAAYRDTDGQDNEFATYAFKRLLDKEFRARYDARPQGQPMDDKYRWIELKRKAAAMWAAAETVKRGRAVDSGEFVPADIRAKMDADTRRQQEGEDVRAKRNPRSAPGASATSCGTRSRVDQDRLPDGSACCWRACWDRDIPGRFAVGVIGRAAQHLAAVGCATRARHRFLHEDMEPREELAEADRRVLLDNAT